MAASNNNLNPEWQPTKEPNESAGMWLWRKLIQQYVYELRGQQSNISDTIQNLSNNVTQQITKVTQQIANNNGNNNSAGKPPVIYGSHGTRISSTYAPSLWAGYIFIETDRYQAAYYSNSVNWILIEGTGQGSFENRWSDLNSSDFGMSWIETSRNNISSTAPFPQYQWSGSNWNFRSGEFYRNQSDLGTLANTFAPANAAKGNDIGARVNVVDFAGQLQWTNANNNNGWAWGPDDCRMHGMGPIPAEADPSPVTGWQIYAGNNNVTYLKSDGSTGSVNLPNLIASANGAFLEFGNVNSGPNGPVAPTLAMNSYTPTGNVTGGGVASNTASAIISVSGVGVTSNSATFVTDVSGGGGGTFTGDPATLTGAISNNGTPQNIVRRPWFRR